MFKYLIIVICSSLSLTTSGYAETSQDKPPVTIVIFGATGDLTAKKLFPAIYNLDQEGELHENFSLIGVGRQPLSQESFQPIVYNSLIEFSRCKPNDVSWEAFRQHIVYHQLDFTSDEGYKSLFHLLENHDIEIGAKSTPIFYLATDSLYFPIIIRKLYENKMLHYSNDSNFPKVIIEKPFGYDLNSALDLQEDISQFLDESQIYRIDHYLGKGGVQKLINLRFENSRFEELFHNNYVNNIQLTISESIGIGTRASFYENTGHLRDVVQNHTMQLLGLLLMDSKVNSQQKKIEALQAFRPFPIDQIKEYVFRGQYSSGTIGNQIVPGYNEEKGIPADSQVETFLQAKFYIDLERWKGVPVYSRSGKRLRSTTTQITLNLLPNPQGIDSISIVIQPNSQVYITKEGVTEKHEVPVDPSFSRREAYENLLLSCVKAERQNFVTMEEVIATWRLFTPLLEFWDSDQSPPVSLYQAGKWGSESADQQLIEEGVNEWNIIINNNKTDLLK
jgi:glucose-6-phosphate 1-dehydrogenase